MKPGQSQSVDAAAAKQPRAALGPLPWWRRLWEGWKRVAEAIGNFNARLLLTVFYVIFVSPLAIGIKLFADPLRLKRTSESYWAAVPERRHDMEEAQRQFS